MSSGVPDIVSYSFFNSFKDYALYDVHIENEFTEHKIKKICNSFSDSARISKTESANNICEKFIYLYKFICSRKSQKQNQSLDSNDIAYLNYWLNNKLRNATISHNITVKDFYESMSLREVEFVGNGTFEKKLYDLEEKHFNNMNLLNYLYDNYGVIFKNISTNKKEEKISCLQNAPEFINNYKKCIIQCPINDTNFCKALKHFKEEYDKTLLGDDSITEKCLDQELLRLPTYKDVSVGDKITMVGTILGPSFGTLFASVFLYKFTPFGQWIHAKIRRNKGVDSELYEDNDPSFLNISDNEIISFDRNPYHISYDSVVNS
ncbi:PIR Superfamily Protein [Plasmodium ovale wallikeri]|uniref:PIR Superfamily Protein n=1 Tax=Plasmodium ovale wallikeri TaxID=864142 RepID=A0A1A9AJL0_PLAOA|nr:PIR Superfamily Protein [Plasmodium ovale wallikeri]SBT56678.1 PIR Superfamily Protein [Plasmodium ovale wallikeri]